MALMYCKKCGRLVQGHYNDNDESPFYCDCCESVTYKVPKEYLISETVPVIKSDLKQQFIEDYIKSSPEFDQQTYNNRDKILAENHARYNQVMEHGRAVLEGRDKGNKYGVSCPYCHATNVKKVSATSRVASSWIFGLASKKIGKQWHCNKCGSDF